ncbi:C40 family peptidase [Myceligenerans crystallogenes]
MEPISVPSIHSTTPDPIRPGPSRRGRGRHRAATRPGLGSLLRAAGERAAAASGRGAVVAAAGSGVLLSLAAPSAHAAPGTQESSTALASKPVKEAFEAIDLDALAAQARETVADARVVTVARDVRLKVETAPVSVTPAVETEAYQAQLAAEAEAEAAAEAAALAAEAAAVEIPAAAAGNDVVSIAMRYLGVPYVWGGNTPAGFDCSGFTSYVYAQVGIDLPRTSSEQRYAGTTVSSAQAQPGDLIWSPGHIAIYAGDGMQIEAPVPGETVRYSSIWQSNPTFIRVG